MALVQTAIAFIVGVVVTVLASAGFYTQQIVAAQQALGVSYPSEIVFQLFQNNLVGLAANGLGAVFAIALLIGFVVAFGLKRVLRPLAPIAYPVAGAAAVIGAILLIEYWWAGGGAGVFGGARTPVGLALQGVAGGVGGALFAFLRPKRG
ncbi:MAG: hypothetical protein AAF850_02115 [Pseudomonadota bacterium]